MKILRVLVGQLALPAFQLAKDMAPDKARMSPSFCKTVREFPRVNNRFQGIHEVGAMISELRQCNCVILNEREHGGGQLRLFDRFEVRVTNLNSTLICSAQISTK